MRPLLIGSLVSLLALAACQKKDAAQPAATPTPQSPTANVGGPIDNLTFAPITGVDVKALTKSPSGLYWRDLTVGSGDSVKVGQVVSVHYTGWLPNGQQFDASTANDPPLAFPLGRGRVIPGWDEGVAGMRIGGKRQLVIPAELGYGAAGSGPIPPNSVLVFTVEVVGAK
jgi:FKBP-type peptidyl-prolyl cis-trans isomerase